MKLPPEALAKLRAVQAAEEARIRADRRLHLEALTIETKLGQTTTIEEAGGLKTAQRKVNALRHHCDYVWKCPHREIDYKSRQQGLTTNHELNMMLDEFEFGWNCLVLAHDVPSAKNIFHMLREVAYKNYPFAKPRLLQDTAKLMAFGRIEVLTAKNAAGARSRTRQSIHASEAAFWEDGREAAAGLLQTVRRARFTRVIVESTANSEDSLFHPMCMNALKYCRLNYIPDASMPFGFRIERRITDARRWNGYHLVFISAVEDEDCYDDCTEEEQAEIMRTLDEEEKWILEEIFRLPLAS